LTVLVRLLFRLVFRGRKRSLRLSAERYSTTTASGFSTSATGDARGKDKPKAKVSVYACGIRGHRRARGGVTELRPHRGLKNGPVAGPFFFGAKSASLNTTGHNSAVPSAVPLYYRSATAPPASAIGTVPSIIPIAVSYSDIDPAGTDTNAHLRERGKGGE